MQVVNNGTIFQAETVIYSVSSTGEVSTTPVPASDDNPIVADIKENEITPTSSVLSVGSANGLVNLAASQSSGAVEGSLNIVLTKNIDLSGKTWVPFGANASHAFEGTIDGNNHSIIGLSDNGYTGELYTTSSTKITGDNYGFIADSKGEVEVKNIKFVDVNIKTKTGNAVGVVVGRTTDTTKFHTESLTVTNIKVSGHVEGQDKVAGLVGYCCGTAGSRTASSRDTKVVISNCEVDASIFANNGYRAGGLIGTIGDGSVVSVASCSSKGSVGVSKIEQKWTGSLFSQMSKSSAHPIQLSVTGFTTSMNAESPVGKKFNPIKMNSIYLGIKQNSVDAVGEDVSVGSSFELNNGASITPVYED